MPCDREAVCGKPARHIRRAGNGKDNSLRGHSHTGVSSNPLMNNAATKPVYIRR